MKQRKPVRSRLFQASYLLTRKSSVITHYRELMETQWWSHDDLAAMQLEQLRRLLAFSYAHVPYYHELFDALGLEAASVTSVGDLQRLPILTKQTIKQHRAKLQLIDRKGLRYEHGSTGGSTGEPLQYLMTIEDLTRGIALLHRGWSYGGYSPGDRMAKIAGSSLVPTVQSALHRWAVSLLRNVRSYSTYGMSSEMLMRYTRSLNDFKPKFLRGYASSIYTVASFIRERDLTVKFRPRAVFTTAEKLLEGQRRVIEEVFGTEVFDNYGLNDGGVSAYECEQHNGMHIDMERAILEVVDENGCQVIGRPGRILATSLHNYAMPFIRYDTGDIGVMDYCCCSCGRRLPLLKDLVGRTTDVLEVNGRKIGSPVLTVLLGKFDIEQYQIVQESADSLTCRIVRGVGYTKRDEEAIRKSLTSHLGPVDIIFDYATSLNVEAGTKHKFIIDRRGDGRGAGLPA